MCSSSTFIIVALFRLIIHLTSVMGEAEKDRRVTVKFSRIKEVLHAVFISLLCHYYSLLCPLGHTQSPKQWARVGDINTNI